MIKPQPGYVIVKWVEEEEAGEEVRDSGLILSEHVASRLKEEATHLEWDILSVSTDSTIQVDEVSKAITSKFEQPIKVVVGSVSYGILPEINVVATY